MATDTLHADIDEIMPAVIADRRYLHTIPELGMQEFKTSAYVLERLRSLPVENIRTGIAVTGITAMIHGTKPSDKPGKVGAASRRYGRAADPRRKRGRIQIADSRGDARLRARCPHRHAARSRAALLTDRRDQFSGTVKLLFQPAEEGPGGGEPMIKEGVLGEPARRRGVWHPRRPGHAGGPDQDAAQAGHGLG